MAPDQSTDAWNAAAGGGVALTQREANRLERRLRQLSGLQSRREEPWYAHVFPCLFVALFVILFVWTKEDSNA